MARKCDITGKKTTAGNSRKHKRGSAGGVYGRWSRKATITKRVWRPNLVKATLLVDGKPKKLKVSTKVLKRIRKFGNYGNVSMPSSREAQVA